MVFAVLARERRTEQCRATTRSATRSASKRPTWSATSTTSTTCAGRAGAGRCSSRRRPRRSWRRSGRDLKLFTLKVECEFFAEITAFDELSVRMRLEELTQTQIQFAFDYVHLHAGAAERLVAGDGSGSRACAARTRRRCRRRVPEQLREALVPYSDGAITAGRPWAAREPDRVRTGVTRRRRPHAGGPGRLDRAGDPARQVMGQFATGITVLTAGGRGRARHDRERVLVGVAGTAAWCCAACPGGADAQRHRRPRSRSAVYILGAEQRELSPVLRRLAQARRAWPSSTRSTARPGDEDRRAAARRVRWRGWSASWRHMLRGRRPLDLPRRGAASSLRRRRPRRPGVLRRRLPPRSPNRREPPDSFSGKATRELSTNEQLDGIAPEPTDADDESDYYEGSVTALPRLGRGLLWSDVWPTSSGTMLGRARMSCPAASPPTKEGAAVPPWPTESAPAPATAERCAPATPRSSRSSRPQPRPDDGLGARRARANCASTSSTASSTRSSGSTRWASSPRVNGWRCCSTTDSFTEIEPYRRHRRRRPGRQPAAHRRRGHRLRHDRRAARCSSTPRTSRSSAARSARRTRRRSTRCSTSRWPPARR